MAHLLAPWDPIRFPMRTFCACMISTPTPTWTDLFVIVIVECKSWLVGCVFDESRVEYKKEGSELEREGRGSCVQGLKKCLQAAAEKIVPPGSSRINILIN